MKNHIILLAAIIILIHSNAEADWVDPNDLQLDFLINPFFSGYLNSVTNANKFFYVYHPSENNPSKDPVIVWFSSGPGCSALYSMLYTKGPFIFTPNSNSFRINKYNWNKQANVVFIQTPANTGFSTGQTNSSDYTLAQYNYQALVAFFNRFPALKDQQLYLAGQGYSGTIVPWTAQKILNENAMPYVSPTQIIKLVGIFIGNPCTHPDECVQDGYNTYSYQYLANHYYYSREQWNSYKTGCLSMFRPNCSAIKQKLDNFFLSTATDRRNIYKKCLSQNISGYNVVPCLDQIGILQFLNKQNIRDALHVTSDLTNKWQVCSPIVSQNYIKDPRGSFHIYPQLIAAKLRIWIYSGSLDASNPIVGTMKWIQQLRLNLNLATIEPWESWQYNDIQAGEQWLIRGLRFLTIRSAGHLVFTDQPEIGYYVFDSFLKNKSL